MPTSPALVLKALKEPPRDRKKTKNVLHNGKVKMSDIINIAKQIRHKSYSKDFVGTVLEVLGTCVSVGCTVDGESPKAIQQKIKNGDIEVN
jgi:large subunit ribosomal protein L12e